MFSGDHEFTYLVVVIIFAIIAIYYGAQGEIKNAAIMLIGMILIVALHEIHE